MKRIAMVFAFVAVCGLGVSAAHAGPGCCKSKTGQATCTASGEFPKLVYLVADKELNCPDAAAQMAKEKNTKIVYVVADQKFDCETKAMTALADASEQFVNKFTTVACVMPDGKVMYCDAKDAKSCGSADKASMAKAGGTCHSKETAAVAAKGSSCSKSGGQASMVKAEDKPGCCKGHGAAMASSASCKDMKGVKFMVAGRTFEKYDDAVKAHELAVASIKKVSMQYVVDGKNVGSSSSVCPLAKAAGKVQYVVGNAKTNCETEARVNLAKAQFDALQQPTEKKVAKM